MPTQPKQANRPQRRRHGAVALRVLGLFLVLAAVSLFAGQTLAPEPTERLLGEAKVLAQTSIDDATHAITNTHPVIRLGVSGGQAEMDRCDGTFTEILSYEMDGVLPVYAAHNNCGGDVILGFSVGELVKIEGRDTLYRVVDERRTPKAWASVKELVGMRGAFVLQTCFYGQDQMRFLSLAPVED